MSRAVLQRGSELAGDGCRGAGASPDGFSTLIQLETVKKDEFYETGQPGDRCSRKP